MFKEFLNTKINYLFNKDEIQKYIDKNYPKEKWKCILNMLYVYDSKPESSCHFKTYNNIIKHKGNGIVGLYFLFGKLYHSQWFEDISDFKNNNKNGGEILITNANNFNYKVL